MIMMMMMIIMIKPLIRRVSLFNLPQAALLWRVLRLGNLFRPGTLDGGQCQYNDGECGILEVIGAMELFFVFFSRIHRSTSIHS